MKSKVQIFFRKCRYARKILEYYFFKCIPFRQKKANYTKCIVLGTERVGSNLLRGLLNSHGDVIIFGEIYRDYESIGWDLQLFPRNKKMIKFLQDEPIGFLEKWIFGRHASRMSAIGFKIFYTHAHEENWEQVWEYLSKMKDLKIIHLKRKNALRKFVSKKNAEKTGKWVSKKRVDGKENRPFVLDDEECLKEFEFARDQENKYAALFNKDQILDLFYEDLSKDYSTEIKRVQKFLNLKAKNVKPTTHKQIIKPLPELIENYGELKEKFSGTEWAHFFEN